MCEASRLAGREEALEIAHGVSLGTHERYAQEHADMQLRHDELEAQLQDPDSRSPASKPPTSKRPHLRLVK